MNDMAGVTIQPLSPGVRSYLRTGVALSSVAQCMEELVLNSVDAGATCIAVRIDLSCFKIQVVDNGTGMTQGQLELVGQRYHTSKCHSVEDLCQLRHYGFRGEAIASLTDASSLLEITSRTKQITPTYCKIFNKGSAMKVVLSSVPRPSAGTTVTAHDLFYNMPVRRKAMNAVLEFERVKKRLEGIALMRPAISFSLRNDISGHVVLQTHKTSGVLNVFTSLFGVGRSKTLTSVQGQSRCYSVEGYIGKEGFSRKDLQFVYINKRLVLKTKIHKVINFVLGKSLILRKKGFFDKQGESKQQESMTSSPTKYSEKFGVFVINISCPYTEYDVTFDPAKTLVEFKDWDTVCTCIEDVVSEFLKRECLMVGIQDMVVDSPAEESKEDTAEISTDRDQVSTGDNSGGPAVEEISTSNNRSFLTSKLVRRAAKHVDSPDVCEEENVIETTTENGLNVMVTPEKVTNIEKKTDGSDIIEDKQSVIKNVLVEETDGCTSDSGSSVEVSETGLMDNPTTDSSGDSNKNCDKQHLDSDDVGTEVTDSLNEDGDYESEDPVPKFDWKLMEKRKDTENKHHTLIRLETPHVGFNGGSTLSLIRKGQSSCMGNLKGTSSKKTSCYEAIRKRLQCNKTSECNGKRSDSGQDNMCHPTKTTDLPVSEINDFNKKEVAISHKGQLEKSIETSKTASTQRIGESETECLGSVSQDNMHAHRLPKKRSTLAESSVAAKLARMSRSRQQVGVSRGKALDRELDNTVHQTRHTITDISHNGAVSSKYPQERVPPKLSGNQNNLFDRPCLIVPSNGIPNTTEKIDHGNSIAISLVNPRKDADTSNVQRKFLTTASFVQTYNDVFQNYSGSEDTSHQDRKKCNNSEIGHLGKRSSDHQCHTIGCNLTNSYEGWKSTKQAAGDSDMTPENYTETSLRIEQDSTNRSINKDISLRVGGSNGLFQFISSESETDSMHDAMLFEGTPNLERQLGNHRVDNSNIASEADLLCYEEFDYAQAPRSNKESYIRNPQQTYQPLDNSKPFTDSAHTPDTNVSLQGKEKTYTFNTTLNLGDMESSNEYTMETTQSFVSYLSHTDMCPSSLVTPRLSDTPQSQGFVPFTDVSTVIDKQGLTECVQESQGFVPVPAFTENRVISPAVSEGFSPVMMDDDLRLDDNSSSLSKHEDPKASSHLRASKNLCEDSNGSVSTTSQRKEIQVEEPSTHLEMETLGEYLDSYSSSIAELYEEDMSYLEKTKKRRMSSIESSDCSESPVTSVIHENSSSSVLKSQSDLSDSVPSLLTNEIFKTQAHFRKVPEDSVQETLTDSSNLASNKNFSQLFVRENSEASLGTCVLGKEMPSIIDEHICLTEENWDLLTSNDETNYTDIGGNRQQNVSQYVKPGYVSENVQRVIMSDEEERCVQCELIQNSTEVVCDRTDQTALSNTERTFDSPDTDNNQVIQLELFQRCNPIHDSDKNKTMASQCLGTLPYRNSESSTNSKLERKTTLNVPGLSSKQLKVLRGESNRKGKLPMNIIDLCNKSKIDSSVKGDKSESTDTSGDTSPWSDVDEGDLLAVTENGQSCKERNLHNKIDTTDIKMVTTNDKIKSSEKQMDTTESKKDTVENMISTSEDTCTIDCEQPWVEIEVPKTGEKLYVNSITGHNRPRDGSWEPPPSEVRMSSPTSATTTKSKVNDLSPQSHNTLLQIMSEHMETMDKEDEDLLSVKWADTRHCSDSTKDKQAPGTTKCVEDLLQNWDNPVFARPEQSVAAVVEASRRSRGLAKAHGVLHYHKFTKDMLQDVKVIGQVDNKFIACMTSSRTNNMSTVPNLMLLFDQHAAHERVRLQELTKDAYERDNRICRSAVTPAKHLTLEEEEVRVMVSYREEFARLGVDFTTDRQSRDTILVHTIPACIVQKEVNEVKRKRESVVWNVVLNLLKEHVEMLMSTSGVLGRLPATLHKVLCSQACHGAIKFGDPLSVEECKELLDSLSNCDLPFQCAHGRPSLMPLLELDKLESDNKTRKPNLWKISKKIQTS